MTISNSVKAQLFALYYGQDHSRYHSGWKGDLDNNIAWETLKHLGEDHYLQLRSVSDLTDEEKKSLLIICGWDVNYKLTDLGLLTIKITHHNIAVLIFDDGEDGSSEICNLGVDYLRSIGIAISFTYLNDTNHPITLLVQEQVELGWIKLSTSSMP